jgi:hypothetical protein
VLDVFDRLEVPEAIIQSRALSPVTPMTDAVIDELNAAFGWV